MKRLLREDSGMSLAELMVVLGLMGFVMATTYGALMFTNRANGVADTQAQFASNITAPLDAMDVTFSQSTSLTGGILDPYVSSVRLPVHYDPNAGSNQFQVRQYSAGADGRLIENVLVVTNGVSTPLRQPVVWSTTNANRALGRPMFRYFRSTANSGSMPATNAALVDKVNIEIWTVREGKQFHDSRWVFLRNQ